MSACVFLAADYPLYDTPAESRRYPVFDPVCRAPYGMDNHAEPVLMDFPDVSCYTDMRFGALMDWDCSEAMAERYVSYIETLLQYTDRVEVWHVWLVDDYYEPDERPVVRRCRITRRELTPDILCELYDARIWNNREKRRPSFYCLEVMR